MSRVFLATDLQLERQVVIKLLGGSVTLSPAADPVSRSATFKGEVRLAANLQHPYIVPLLTADAVDGLLYYTMPYVAGESLRELLRTRGKLEVREAVRIWRDILDAIAHAHARGVVHRDIKPGNILVSGRHALVTDFGIACALQGVSGDSAQPTELIGTPAYMAPEQRTGSAAIDKRVDIYQAGLVMYEMLAGHLPSAGALPEGDTVPRPLAELISRCLSPDPDQRPPSAEALLAEIDGIEEKPQRGRRLWLAVAGLAIAGALAGLGIWLPSQQDASPSSPTTPRTANAVAWDWYQQGAAPELNRSNSGRIEAIGHFRKAIEADPGFAGARARLAATLQFVADGLPPADPQRTGMMSEAWNEMQRALALDADDPDAHVTWGRWLLFVKGDLKQAETELLRAVAIDPRSWRGYESLSIIYMYMGRTAEQFEAAQRAQQFEPNSVGATRVWALALAENGRCGESLDTLQQFKSLTPPATVAGVLRGLCYIVLGRWRDAISELQWSDAHGGKASPGFLVFALARSGQRAAAESLLDDLLKGRVYSHGAFGIAVAHAGLGRRDEAFAWLEKSAAENTLRPYLLHPVLAELRSDPRYERIKAQLDLNSD